MRDKEMVSDSVFSSVEDQSSVGTMYASMLEGWKALCHCPLWSSHNGTQALHLDAIIDILEM